MSWVSNCPLTSYFVRPFKSSIQFIVCQVIPGTSLKIKSEIHISHYELQHNLQSTIQKYSKLMILQPVTGRDDDDHRLI